MADIDGPGLATTATAIRDDGGKAVTVVGDVTEEKPAAELIEAAIEHFGQIDGLVNNVGGSRNSKIWDMPVEDWDHTIKLIFVVRSSARAAVPHMMKRKRGAIICLSSGARRVHHGPLYYQGGSAYSTCKAGVHGFA